MPPKKGQAAAQKKAIQNKQKQIVEDKTFGLKNKNKSKKVQNFVHTVNQQVKNIGRDHRLVKKEENAQFEKKARKAAEEEAARENALLFKAVIDGPKKPQGEMANDPNVDPKTLLCGFFKSGLCKRGNKCRYSHDLEIERKVAKINLYEDPRELDTMDKWDQQKLEEVVAKKMGNLNNETKIICKYFLDAIENAKYGWFWKCPNGSDCIYKHALPPGYVFKPKKKPGEEEEDKEAVDENLILMETIEEERKKLDILTCTPVTDATFRAWKAKRRALVEKEIEEKRLAAEKANAGKGVNVLSGRALFQFDPSLFADDDDAAEDDLYNQIQEDAEDDGPALDGRLVADEDDEKGDNDGEEQGEGEEGEEGGEEDGAGDAAPQDASLFLQDEDLPEDDGDDE